MAEKVELSARVVQFFKDHPKLNEVCEAEDGTLFYKEAEAVAYKKKFVKLVRPAKLDNQGNK